MPPFLFNINYKLLILIPNSNRYYLRFFTIFFSSKVILFHWFILPAFQFVALGAVNYPTCFSSLDRVLAKTPCKIIWTQKSVGHMSSQNVTFLKYYQIIDRVIYLFEWLYKQLKTTPGLGIEMLEILTINYYKKCLIYKWFYFILWNIYWEKSKCKVDMDWFVSNLVISNWEMWKDSTRSRLMGVRTAPNPLLPNGPSRSLAFPSRIQAINTLSLTHTYKYRHTALSRTIWTVLIFQLIIENR